MKSRLLVIPVLLLFGGCVSPLREAKVHYAVARELARTARTEPAVAAFKRVVLEADLASRRNPSAQAFMLKGLAEVELERWAEAGESFRRAFVFGFETGEKWASDVTLLGLARSFEERGLEDSASDAYSHILDKSSFRPALMTAAQRHTDLVLSRSLALNEKEKERVLAGQARIIARLLDDDFGCGFYHYLSSQISGHRGDFRRSYEEAVTARELGLPSERILRDNDVQILFCHEKLESLMPEADWKTFEESHRAWTRKWGWKDGRTPGWKGN